MSAQPTPGPWFAPNDGEHPNPVILGPNGRPVAHAMQRDVAGADPRGLGISVEQAKANATLIAAAPELLAALVRLMEGLSSTCGVDDADLEAAADSYRKATGDAS